MKKPILIISTIALCLFSCKKTPEPTPVISPNGYTVTGTNTVFGNNFIQLTANNWRLRIKEEFYADTLYSRVVLSNDPSELAYFSFAKDGTMVLYPSSISATASITNLKWYFLDNETKLGWSYLYAGTTTISVQSNLIKLESDSLVLRRDLTSSSITKKIYSRYTKYQ